MDTTDDDNQENEEREYHPIDQAFFATYLAVRPELLAWALWFFHDPQRAQDLLDAALDGTLSGKRRWPKDITLKMHLKATMKSIDSHRRAKLSELKLARYDHEELGPEPGLDLDCSRALHTLSPEEVYEDAEGTALAERMADEIFEMTEPGSIERGVLLEAQKGNFKTSDVAKALEVSPRQVTRAKESLRITKVRPVFAKYGLEDPKLKTNKKKTGEAQ